MLINSVPMIWRGYILLIPQSAEGSKPTWFYLFFAVTAVSTFTCTWGQGGQWSHRSIQTIWIIKQKILVHFFAYWGDFSLIWIHIGTVCVLSHNFVIIIKKALVVRSCVSYLNQPSSRQNWSSLPYFEARIASSFRGARALCCVPPPPSAVDLHIGTIRYYLFKNFQM